MAETTFTKIRRNALPLAALMSIVASAHEATAQSVSYPAAYVRNAYSPWNTQIAGNASYSSVPNLTNYSIGLNSWLGAGWAIPFYVANPNASQNPARLRPLLFSPGAWQNVYSGAWKRYGNSSAVEQQILSTASTNFTLYQNRYTGNPYSSLSTTSWVLPASYNGLVNPPGGAQFYFSTNMQPASAADGHMAVLQPNGKIVELYGAIMLSTGQVVALSYGVTDPNSLADGSQNGQTASMLPSYAGLVDDFEASVGVINHAMAITVPPALLKPAAVYPAYAFDRDATTNGNPYRGVLPMGSRLALPYSVSISSLGLQTKEGAAIATAAQKYGFYVADRGGGGVTIRATANPTTTNAAIRAYNWPLQSDLNKIIARLQRVN